MKNNLGQNDRFLRGAIGVALLAYAWWAHSLLALGFALFTIYEAVSSWCILYSLFGMSSCPISNNTAANETTLDARRLGTAGGIIWGATMFFMTIASIYTGYGADWLHLMMGVYPGYEISWTGGITGLLAGFLDGFVGFFLIAWLYNKLK